MNIERTKETIFTRIELRLPSISRDFRTVSFHATGLLLYPLKRSENLWLHVFAGHTCASGYQPPPSKTLPLSFLPSPPLPS